MNSSVPQSQEAALKMGSGFRSDRDKSSPQPVQLETAIEMILQYAQPVGTGKIGIRSALGRVLSEDIHAPVNLPPFNRSPLDGYAVRSEDIAGATTDNPVLLEIRKEITTGNCGNGKVELGKNQAAIVMTGTPLPPGADVVIKLEDVRRIEQKIEVVSPLPAYSNYCFAGEDIRQGERVLSRGSVIDPSSVGILAALGISVVPVYRRPRVAIISNGDELVEVDKQLKPGQIFDSNSYTIASCVRQAGARPIMAGTVGDNMELIARKIAEMLKSADMIITTGGVSVGDFDLVRNALLSQGVKILFHRIAMRPGTPALGAVKNGKLIICLSGNQAAAFVTFHLLAAPAIAGLMGITRSPLTITTAVLHDSYLKTSTQRNFLRGRTFFDEGVLKVKLAEKQDPGIIHSTLYCNALIDVPANSAALQAGTRVKIFLLPSTGMWQN